MTVRKSEIDTIENYIVFLTKSKKCSENTLNAYKHDLFSFYDFLHEKELSVFSVGSKEISEYKTFLSSVGKSVSTVSRSMSSLRSFYKYLFVSGTVSENPTAGIKNDKTQKKQFSILSEKEIDMLLSQPDISDFKGKRDKAMLELLYATGLKVGELMAINVSDINLKMSYLRCRSYKNSVDDRVMLLYPSARDAVYDYITNVRAYFVSDSSENALFVNVNGERMTRQGFWKLLKAYAEKAKIDKPITPYTLRHSFAAHLIENGADVRDVTEILGYSDVSSVQVYTELIQGKLNAACLKYNHRSHITEK